MKGMPKFIQTRADMQNLFAMWQQGYDGFTTVELTDGIKAVLGQQYHHVPIISVEGSAVTTRYFYEAVVGAKTITNATITAVEHITEPDDIPPGSEENDIPTRTVITLSEAMPSDATLLEIYNPDSFFTQHGFDLAETDYILGVLETTPQPAPQPPESEVE